MSEIDDSLNAYLAQVSYAEGLTPFFINMISAAYLSGYRDGLERGSQIAERSMDTALEAMREHYPETSDNALRNYLSRPVHELLRESDSEAARAAFPDRSAAQDDPRGERDR